MSGGSYGHLWAKDTPRDLANAYETIEEMAADLEALAGEQATESAAKRTRRVLRLLDEAFKAARPLLGYDGVWKAMEWFRSGDTDEGPLNLALLAYNRGDKEPKP
jgi:hypothetical protein